MSPSIHHIIPEGERYCIWMDAGVVDYKLCNHHFKCDECPFDAQIRTETRLALAADRIPAAGAYAGTTNDEEDRSVPVGNADAHADVPPSRNRSEMKRSVESSRSADDEYASTLREFLRAVERQRLPDDRLYSSNHTWAKRDDDGLYALGIDHFIGTMLAAAHSVAFSVPPAHIKASEPFAWIVANGETLAVRSPIAGTIVENNTALTERSDVIHSDPYRQGWIAKIRPEKEAQTASLQPAQRFTSTLRHDAERFEKTIRSTFRRLRPGAGTTLFDGGTVVTTFEEMLGTKTIYEILEQFLRSSKQLRKEA